MGSLLRTTAALLIGACAAVIGVLLCVVSPVAPDLVQGRTHFLIPIGWVLENVALLTASYALGCAIVAVPCWLLLARLRLANWMSAAVLGLALADACLLSRLGEGWDAGSFLIVGMVGLMSGLITWAAAKGLASKVR